MVHGNLTEAWLETLNWLLTRGRRIGSRVGESREWLNYHITLGNIEQNFVLNSVRRADPAYASAEFLWYMSGNNKSSMMEAYAPQYKNFSEEDGTCYGAYGPRIRTNIDAIVSLLRNYPDTRQAVLVIWRVQDIRHAHLVNDMPCTIALQFLSRGGRLYCTAMMRSNDVWLGLPYDIFCFTQLQRVIADELGLDYGTYHHAVGSMHLYERDVKKAEESLLIGNNNIDFVRHNWHNDSRLSDFDTVAMLEVAARETGITHELIVSPSPANDMFNACYHKLKPNCQDVDFCSDIFQLAWQLRYPNHQPVEMKEEGI